SVADRLLGLRLDMDTTPGPLQRSSGTTGATCEHLAEDRHRGLGGSLGADVEPARTRDALQSLLVDALSQQTLSTSRLVLAPAERANVERLRLEAVLQRGNVEFVVVRQDDNRRLIVRLNLSKHVF